ncbi:MAG TPA: hypothetical protein VFN19_08360, partial [Candidatus Nanopelagicales bacterium]|nr:hypothetical protein [Candidatus Nanopelagicales bacterium]
MPTTVTEPSAGRILLGRYVLDDRVGGDQDAPVWRAKDNRLRRPVSVRLLSADDPRANAVRTGARQAAAFTDRRTLPVLDVGDDAATGLLIVVSEWVPAIGLGDYLAARGPDRLAPREAADVALELARCLTAAHAAGIAHGHLHPNSVIVTDSGEVRLRGLGVAAALASSDGDPPGLAIAAAADVSGVGSVLYAGLTGRWPAGPCDHLPGTARLTSGALPWPSRVIADVPAALDEIAARAVVGCALPKGRVRFGEVADVAAALTAAVDGAAPVTTPATNPRGWPRALGVAAAVAAIVGLGAVGVSLASGSVTRSGPVTARNTGSIGLGLTTPAPPGATVGPATDAAIPIVAVRDLDPYGSDGRENPDLVGLAVDDDPATAWTTRTYDQADLSGKRGVGLRLDLGAPRPVSSVRLVLVGNGTDVALLAGDEPRNRPGKYEVLARAKGAPTEVTLRTVTPVTARYLVVWLTKLAP